MEMLKKIINFILGFICLIFLLSLVGCDNSHEQQQQLMTQQQLMQQNQLMTKEIKQLEQQMKELQDYCDYLKEED